MFRTFQLRVQLVVHVRTSVSVPCFNASGGNRDSVRPRACMSYLLHMELQRSRNCCWLLQVCADVCVPLHVAVTAWGPRRGGAGLGVAEKVV